LQVDLVTPIDASWWPRLWAWVQQHPALNTDDSTPTTEAAFVALMQARTATERFWGVTADGAPCGVIAYRAFTPRGGMFHGICFDEGVWGTGVTRTAVRGVLAALATEGVGTVLAAFFPENVRVDRFLARLGAVEEPTLGMRVRRSGHWQPLQIVRFDLARQRKVA
jgi:RimJ/RimL family protein N-acetyltransferase